MYIFDLYTIALSKIARGFDSDLDDVIFMLKGKLINFDKITSITKNEAVSTPAAAQPAAAKP